MSILRCEENGALPFRPPKRQSDYLLAELDSFREKEIKIYQVCASG